MRKNNSPVRVCLSFILLSLLLSGPVGVFGNWGMEVGRANEGDVVKLLSDWTAMKMAENRIERAMQHSLGRERQKALLGHPETANPGILLDDVYDWWLKEVMGPAEAIAINPAASCAQARLASQTLLGMMRQRQLLGMDDDGDSPRNAQLNKMFDTIQTKMIQRCRDEALDECVATGRFNQIIQTEQGMSRQDQLIGNAGEGNDAWVDDALKQCAIYELHFVSTTKVAQILNIETVRDGKITLRFEAGASGILNALSGGKKLGDILKGETTGSVNPFLVSVKCSQPPLQVTCSPGASSDPVRSRINALELKHREFYVDPNGISRERIVGDDELSFELAGGIYALNAVVKIPNYADMPIPMQALGFAFYIAHKKDRLGSGPTVKIERNKRGVYPVIFDFPYDDQDTDEKVSASDSTVFQLIHKPEPKPFPARPPEPIRKPLKPRPGR